VDFPISKIDMKCDMKIRDEGKGFSLVIIEPLYDDVSFRVSRYSFLSRHGKRLGIASLIHSDDCD